MVTVHMRGQAVNGNQDATDWARVHAVFSSLRRLWLSRRGELHAMGTVHMSGQAVCANQGVAPGAVCEASVVHRRLRYSRSLRNVPKYFFSSTNSWTFGNFGTFRESPLPAHPALPSFTSATAQYSQTEWRRTSRCPVCRRGRTGRVTRAARSPYSVRE